MVDHKTCDTDHHAPSSFFCGSRSGRSGVAVRARVATHRKRAELRQSDVAEVLGITPATMSEQTVKMADLFNVPVEVLLPGQVPATDITPFERAVITELRRDDPLKFMAAIAELILSQGRERKKKKQEAV